MNEFKGSGKPAEELNNKESKARHSARWPKYLAVILAGVLAVCAAVYFIPKGSSAQNAGTTAGTSTVESWTEAPETSRETEAASSETTAPQTTLPATTVSLETSVEGTPMDSYYQYVNDYDWQDLYTLMILIGQTGIGINEGSEGKNTAFSIFSFNPEFDPMIFVGFNDPETNKSVMTLYITDGGFVYELLQVKEAEIYINPQLGAIMVEGENAYYRYSPHVLMKTEITDGNVPAGFVKLPIIDSTGMIVTRQNVEEYAVYYTAEAEGVQP